MISDDSVGNGTQENKAKRRLGGQISSSVASRLNSSNFILTKKIFKFRETIIVLIIDLCT